MSLDRKPGTIPEGRIGVYDRKRQLRGVVGPKATSVTAARFTGELGAKLTKVDGRPAWTLPQVSAAAVGMQQKNTGTNPAAASAVTMLPPQGQGSTQSRAASMRANKGSNR